LAFAEFERNWQEVTISGDMIRQFGFKLPVDLYSDEVFKELWDKALSGAMISQQTNAEALSKRV